jgi:putative acetyltransferase
MVTIRKARPEDGEPIGRVHRSSIRELCGGHYAPEKIDVWARPRRPEHYERAILDKDFYVATEEGEVVGFGTLNAETSEVEAVYVGPAAAGRGVGTLILRALEGRARELGLKSLRLDSSLNAVGFYERAGFRREGTGEHRLGGVVDIPCAHMSKRLAD